MCARACMCVGESERERETTYTIEIKFYHLKTWISWCNLQFVAIWDFKYMITLHWEKKKQIRIYHQDLMTSLHLGVQLLKDVVTFRKPQHIYHMTILSWSHAIILTCRVTSMASNSAFPRSITLTVSKRCTSCFQYTLSPQFQLIPSFSTLTFSNLHLPHLQEWTRFWIFIGTRTKKKGN